MPLSDRRTAAPFLTDSIRSYSQTDAFTTDLYTCRCFPSDHPMHPVDDSVRQVPCLPHSTVRLKSCCCRVRTKIEHFRISTSKMQLDPPPPPLPKRAVYEEHFLRVLTSVLGINWLYLEPDMDEDGPQHVEAITLHNGSIVFAWRARGAV